MPAVQYDVLAIGNAIVDVMRRCDEAFLANLPGPKGHMTLVPSSRAIEEILKKLKPGVEVAGGGATNMAVGVGFLGGRAAFIGRVAEDDFGRIFRHDLKSAGVSFATTSTAVPGKETARSLILVTPDGRRTMFTFLGCASEIDLGMIDRAILDQSRIVFAEGFLMDRIDSAALLKAVSTATAAGKRVAVALSDALCVKRHRQAFLRLIKSGVAVVFANEAEVKALYETQNVEDAIRQLRGDAQIAVMTRSDKGSLILTRDDAVSVPAERVEKVVDRTGAGELYAAGFLYGLSRGLPLAACGRLGAFAAAEIVQVMGARPQQRLGHLAKMRGLL
ncbi:MAG: adenosine kinase [Hyphomicrobiaceae bacterium]|nr:adenosine kinase [Hyphomicrobiaceae bacterium]